MTGTLPDFPAVVHALCQRFGATPDAAVIAQLHQERLAAKARPFTNIAAPIVGLIQRLHAMSIKLGVLSNAAWEEGAAWETCVLAPFFDTVVFSYQVGLMKPDPQVYWLACERLGTTAADTLFVGGGGSDELVGAAQAGLTAYWAQWYFVPWPAEKRPASWRERATRSGRFNPGFKEAPYTSQCVFQGIASRKGGCREPPSMRRHRREDLIRGDRKRLSVSLGQS